MRTLVLLDDTPEASSATSSSCPRPSAPAPSRHDAARRRSSCSPPHGPLRRRTSRCSIPSTCSTPSSRPGRPRPSPSRRSAWSATRAASSSRPTSWTASRSRKTLAGLRRARASTRSTTRTTPRGTDRDDTKRRARCSGLVFSPTSALSLHVSGGTAFAPPSTQVLGPREPETSRSSRGGGQAPVPRRQGVPGRRRVYALRARGHRDPRLHRPLQADGRPALARLRAGRLRGAGQGPRRPTALRASPTPS